MEACRQHSGWHLVREFLPPNTRSLEIPRTIDIQVRNVESLWFKLGKTNQKSTFSFSIYIFADELTRFTCHSATGCLEGMRQWHQDMPQHSAILWSPSHTKPWRPRRQCRWKSNRCSWRTRLSSVPRPRPGGSDRSKAGVFIQGSTVQNLEKLKSRESHDISLWHVHLSDTVL